VTTRGELEEVEAGDLAEIDTGEVAEALRDLVLGGIVDNEGTTALNVATVAHLANTTTELLGGLRLFNVLISVELLEEGSGSSSLGDALDLIRGNNEGNLSDGTNAVTTGENYRGKRRGSEGRDQSKAALVHINLAVPATPGLGGSKHATTTAHITESTLARARGTTTANTGNTSYGTTGTPGLSRGLVTSINVN
jgi:hypothetical protein